MRSGTKLMIPKETPAYITTVTEDHTVVVPPDLPVGTVVAVVAVVSDEAARQRRFSATLSAIRQAMAPRQTDVEPTDDEIDALVARARKRHRA